MLGLGLLLLSIQVVLGVPARSIMLASNKNMLSCATMPDVHENITVPTLPDPAGGKPDALLPNAPATAPCMSVMEIMYDRGLFVSSNVLRLGLRRSSAILFDPFAALTVLAPTDAAFKRANITSERLPGSERMARLAGSHIVPGMATSRGAVCSAGPGPIAPCQADMDVRSWDNERLTLTMGSERLHSVVGPRNTRSRILRADIPACVAVVHVIDSVIGAAPPCRKKSCAKPACPQGAKGAP